MISSLFKKDPAAEAADALYAAAVEQARAAPFYADLGVPDSVEGRFEMIALHVYLILRRLKGDAPGAKKTAQRLFDAMFRNMDDSLRELGVGDLVIGKKIRKLAENFFGRVGAYDAALEAGPEDGALAEALARNVYESPAPETAAALSAYVRAAATLLDEQPPSRLVGGIVRFPAPGGSHDTD